MSSIPEALSTRFELFGQLEQAYDLLEALRRTGKDAEAEEAFLTARIAGIERELETGEVVAKKLIDQLQSDPIAWTVARLRYLQGYEWEVASARAGVSADTAKSRVYRLYHKRSMSSRE